MMCVWELGIFSLCEITCLISLVLVDLPKIPVGHTVVIRTKIITVLEYIYGIHIHGVISASVYVCVCVCVHVCVCMHACVCVHMHVCDQGISNVRSQPGDQPGTRSLPARPVQRHSGDMDCHSCRSAGRSLHYGGCAWVLARKTSPCQLGLRHLLGKSWSFWGERRIVCYKDGSGTLKGLGGVEVEGGVTRPLCFSQKITVPGVSWVASLFLSLLVPGQGLVCDLEGVSNPSPAP